MKTLIFKFCLTITLLLTLSSCSNNSSDDLVDTTLITTFNYNNDEIELARIINEYRVSIGKNELIIVNHISYKSQEHNDYMIANNVVNHDYFDDRAKNIMTVLGGRTVGENIAYNFSTPNAALHAWLNSPGHKKNLDGDYTHFGISISVSPTTGKKYYTNMFMKQ